MSLPEYPVVKSFQLETAGPDDYSAYHHIVPEEGTDYTTKLLREMGYNPASTLGNRQVCSICGRSGPECIGHPLVVDFSGLGQTFLSEFGITIVKALTSVICSRCKTVVQDKQGIAHEFAELLRLPKTRYKCACITSVPTINQVGEEKIPEGEKRIEWRDGRRRQEKRAYLKLMLPISQVLELIAATDLTPLRLKRDLVLRLFYTMRILLPTSVHPMNFLHSQGGSAEEVSKMTTKYAELIRHATHRNIDQIQILLRMLSVGTGNDRFSGTPSHLMTCDQKTGLLRNSGQNKRSENTGRAVLAPSPYGRSSELMCPQFIMRNLHYEYIVSIHNREWLQSQVGNSVTHLVTLLASSSTNARRNYKRLTPQMMLRLGDRVLKQLRNGDYVTFFRNPTLWRHSLIGYQVKEWDNYCIGLHETNAAGHNADFDGDEGNVMVGADLASRIEMQMMDAAYQLFSSRSGEPVIGIAYNGIVGAYVLSTDNNIDEPLFNKLKSIIGMRDGSSQATSRFGELVIDVDYYQGLARRHEIPYRSGRTLISMLLPRSLNYKRADVVIKDGFMISGKLRAADVSSGLITAIAEIERWRAPYLFVDRGYAMMSSYISHKTLTISALDYVMPGDLREYIIPRGYEERLEELRKEIAELEAKKEQKTIASRRRIEDEISHKLSRLSESVEKWLTEGPYKETGGSIIASMSGARGNVGHIAATVVSIGQVYLGNERYDPNVPRSSYYVPRDSRDIFERGYIPEGYTKGMRPDRLMVAANAARRMALNTYLGTPVSGRTARETAMHQGDIRVSDSLSAIEGDGRILDCMYGYGCDSTRVTHRVLPRGSIEIVVDPVALLDRVNSM